MSTLLPQVVPLTSDEIRRVQTLTLFDVSAEFLAFIIAADRLVGGYTPTQRKGFRRQLEQLIYPVRNQLQASSPTRQTARTLRTAAEYAEDSAENAINRYFSP
ncbi:hypothetical protein LTR70_002697 [Exophiala xenobiotica]|uniref:Core-binding (CB) domain-containing protein n=1 Tax=Lithohypha guttulata TaxID=1690604 RepID=A0ABR0KJI6_9EURO|nr:hypothetical protein LTR24_001803 [Lithohypha guttulata]KAK5324623.1 hypothetical protein LTR70_002697 [Exophiala xenobiotica]